MSLSLNNDSFGNRHEILKAQQDRIRQALYGGLPEMDIIKGGEGSRGGKVIGHTKSGKPIYANFNHEGHKKFTKKDHENAKELHVKFAERNTQDNPLRKEEHWKEAKKHESYSKESNLSNSKLGESVRSWVGDKYSDSHIKTVITGLEESDINDSDYKLPKSHYSSPEKQNDAIDKKVNELYSEFREGMQHKDLSMKDVKEIIHGLVQSKINEIKIEKSEEVVLLEQLTSIFNEAKEKIKEVLDNKQEPEIVDVELVQKAYETLGININGDNK